jgi:phage terminase small subunit
MPALKNAKQELFAQNFVSGMGVYEAYQSAGYDGSPQAANNVRNNPNVDFRIQELMERRAKIDEKATEKAIQKMALTKEYVISRLIENVERSMQASPVKGEEGLFKYDGSVANRSLELLGRELGMFVDRKEVGKPGEFDELNSSQLRQLITERLGMAKQGH